MARVGTVCGFGKRAGSKAWLQWLATAMLQKEPLNRTGRQMRRADHFPDLAQLSDVVASVQTVRSAWAGGPSGIAFVGGMVWAAAKVGVIMLTIAAWGCCRLHRLV